MTCAVKCGYMGRGSLVLNGGQLYGCGGNPVDNNDEVRFNRS